MKVKKALCVLLVAVICFTSVPFSANALANGLYLPQNPVVEFSYNLSDLKTSANSYLSDSSIQSELNTAMNMWSGVRDSNGNSLVTVRLSEQNFNTNFSFITWPFGGNIIGGMDSHPSVEVGGQVWNAVIKISSSVYWSSNPSSAQYDLSTLAAHEIGHLLGIAHCHELGENCNNPTCNSNVMNRLLLPGQTRTLQLYDRASLELIYTNYYGYY